MAVRPLLLLSFFCGFSFLSREARAHNCDSTNFDNNFSIGVKGAFDYYKYEFNNNGYTGFRWASSNMFHYENQTNYSFGISFSGQLYRFKKVGYETGLTFSDRSFKKVFEKEYQQIEPYFLSAEHKIIYLEFPLCIVFTFFHNSILKASLSSGFSPSFLLANTNTYYFKDKKIPDYYQDFSFKTVAYSIPLEISVQTKVYKNIWLSFNPFVKYNNLRIDNYPLKTNPFSYGLGLGLKYNFNNEKK